MADGMPPMPPRGGFFRGGPGASYYGPYGGAGSFGTAGSTYYSYLDARQKAYLSTINFVPGKKTFDLVDTYRLTKVELLGKYHKLPELGINLMAGVLSVPRHFFRHSRASLDIISNATIKKK